METDTLIQCLREGQSTEAIRQLYTSFPPIRYFILKNGGSQDDASDTFQEALLILCKNVLKPEFKLTCAPGTYLFSVCKYLWKDALKKQNKVLRFVPELPASSQVETDLQVYEERELEFRKMDEVLKQVGSKCLGLLKSYYYDRKSMREIAQLFGFGSEQSAKTQKYKCLQRAKAIAKNLNQQPQTLKP